MPAPPAKTAKPPTIVALDDHPVVIDGIRHAMAQHRYELDWVGSVATTQALNRLMNTLREPPNLALIDLNLGLPAGEDGEVWDAISSLTSLGVRCVVFTADQRPVPLRQAVSSGAVGLVLKSDPVCRLIEVLQEVHAGRLDVGTELAYALISDPSACAHLSPRESQVLKLLACGLTRREVARSFTPRLSESTVATYLKRVLEAYAEIGRPAGNTLGAVREAGIDGYLEYTGLSS